MRSIRNEVRGCLWSPALLKVRINWLIASIFFIKRQRCLLNELDFFVERRKFCLLFLTPNHAAPRAFRPKSTNSIRFNWGTVPSLHSLETPRETEHLKLWTSYREIQRAISTRMAVILSVPMPSLSCKSVAQQTSSMFSIPFYKSASVCRRVLYVLL